MNNTKFAKLVVALNCGVPLALLGWDALHDNLGADPVNFSIKTTGLMSLIFLAVSLMVTPVRKISGWNGIISFRRTLGLYAFFYAAVHFGIYYVKIQGWSVGGTFREIFSRVYLIIGMIGLTAMAPLAVTSTNAMIRRLGAKKWQLLHRLAYVAALAGAIHYYMQAKADKKQPTVFIAVIVLLLVYRIASYFTGVKSRTAASSARGFTPKIAFWRGKLRVAEIRRETPSVKTFRLTAADGGEFPFDYLPGQYLNLSQMIDGKKVNRSYTIASSPSRRGYCELTVKREDSGTSSRHLHDSVKVGDLLEIGAPAGKFIFTGSESQSVVFIAGGVGITPFMSKIRYLTDKQWPGEIYLVYCVRSEADIIFKDELDYLQKGHPNLHVTIALTRGQATGYEMGRISPALLARVVPQIAMRRVHFCGPDEMAADITRMLGELGVSPTQIEKESFTPARGGGAAAVEEQEPTQEVGGSLTFAKSAKVIEAVDGKSVLEAAEDIGVPIEFECRSGICGTCKIRLKSGRVAMEVQDGLSAREKADGLILSCQARCLGDVVVEA